MATTVMDLAGDLGVDVGDVEILLEQLGEREPELHDELASFSCRVLDPHGERTALQRGPDDDGFQTAMPSPVDRHDPTPVNVWVGGCPAMVRCGAGAVGALPGRRMGWDGGLGSPAVSRLLLHGPSRGGPRFAGHDRRGPCGAGLPAGAVGASEGRAAIRDGCGRSTPHRSHSSHRGRRRAQGRLAATS